MALCLEYDKRWRQWKSRVKGAENLSILLIVITRIMAIVNILRVVHFEIVFIIISSSSDPKYLLEQSAGLLVMMAWSSPVIVVIIKWMLDGAIVLPSPATIPTHLCHRNTINSRSPFSAIDTNLIQLEIIQFDGLFTQFFSEGRLSGHL